ncbi:MAG TPA: hypothetical protein VEL79_06150 [Vicinamibacterales bacterium]|nr:hypothetical protein [Vicinamibacterales bacterium]
MKRRDPDDLARRPPSDGEEVQQIQHDGGLRRRRERGLHRRDSVATSSAKPAKHDAVAARLTSSLIRIDADGMSADGASNRGMPSHVPAHQRDGSRARELREPQRSRDQSMPRQRARELQVHEK